MYQTPESELEVKNSKNDWPEFTKSKLLSYAYLTIAGLLNLGIIYKFFGVEGDARNSYTTAIICLSILIVIYFLNVFSINKKGRFTLRKVALTLNVLLLCLVAFGSYVSILKGNTTGMIFASILIFPVVTNTVTIFRTGKIHA